MATIESDGTWVGSVSTNTDDAGIGGNPDEAGGTGLTIADPGNGGSNPGSDAASGTKKRRGRPPGSGSTGTRQAKKAAPDLSGIEKILLSAHTMIAAAISSPEVAISPEEAKLLANGIGEVAKHYDMGMSEKTQAWVNLAMVAGAVYGPRLYLMMHRAPNKAEEKSDGSVTWGAFNG